MLKGPQIIIKAFTYTYLLKRTLQDRIVPIR